MAEYKKEQWVLWHFNLTYTHPYFPSFSVVFENQQPQYHSSCENCQPSRSWNGQNRFGAPLKDPPQGSYHYLTWLATLLKKLPSTEFVFIWLDSTQSARKTVTPKSLSKTISGNYLTAWLLEAVLPIRAIVKGIANKLKGRSGKWDVYREPWKPLTYFQGSRNPVHMQGCTHAQESLENTPISYLCLNLKLYKSIK